ncbi:MAG: TonB-dependent receptor [Muribaculaceae bacterium]|nr:TonB-dependent receptor [Muribaculaceae bacterium]
MKAKNILIAAAFAVPLMAAAKGNVTGSIVNKSTGEPMDFVTIQVFDSTGKKPLQIVASSDENGNFTLTGVPDGSYIVKIMNVGSINQDRPVKISGGNVDLGTIHLADDSKVLKELVVEGVRSQMRFELDRKVFSVDANVVAAGQSASELLESIPSVEVDQDGEVSLRGNSSVTIWINGKDSGLTADNRAQILEQIPGESIDRIEVITNPSAKYSPEGTAGIINIILKKDRKAGYFGSAELGANTRGGGNASANINFNTGKWDTFASVGFRMRHGNGGSEVRRLFDNGTFSNSDGDSKSHGNNLFIRLGATYHITDKDEVYVNGFGMFGRRYGHTGTLFTQNIPGLWTSDDQLSRNHSRMNGAHAEWGYTRRWSETHTLEAMVSYNHWGGPQWNGYSETETYPGFTDNTYREQSMDLNTNTWEAKLDYTKQLTGWLKLEAGYNGNYSHENTPNVTTRPDANGVLQIDQDLYNRFIYTNNVSAFYATLGGKVKKFSFSAGLRSESWQVRTKSLGYGENRAEVPEYKKNFFALFPSVFLSYSLPKDNEVQINYTRRIRRPWGGQLNSFRNIADPTNISFGNPELEPQYSNSFELNYLKTWTNHLISLSAYIRTADNMINRIAYMDNDVMYSTFANVSKMANSGCEIVVKNSLFRSKLDLTTTVNLYNNHISGWTYSLLSEAGNPVTLSNDKQNSFAWDARIMAGVKLPWSLALQVTGSYNSEQKEAQGSRQGGWYVDAGIRKIVGNWSFSLNGRDLFDSRKWKSTIYGPGYTQTSKRWRMGRSVGLTIKYSFGNMKANRKGGKNNAEPMGGSGYESEMD